MTTSVEDVRKGETSERMARVLDRLGRRWALRVLWELRGEALTFRRLQRACGGVSPSVLQRRLNELRELGAIEQVPRLGYRLSVHGERLFPVLVRLEDWGRSLKASDLEK